MNGSKRPWHNRRLVASSPYLDKRPRTSSFIESKPSSRLHLDKHREQRCPRGSTFDRPSSSFAFAGRKASPERSIDPEDDRVVEEREDADSLNEIILCVDMRNRGTVGCCYYVAREQKLYVMAEVAYGGIEVIQTCELNRIVLGAIYVTEPEHIEIRPSPEFSYETGRNKLINLDLFTGGNPTTSLFTPQHDDLHEMHKDANEVGFNSRQGQFLRLSVLIDMESRLTVGCAGALLTYIGRRKAVEYPTKKGSGITLFHISNIESFNLQDTMFVNADTLASLQILQSEFSPNTHSQGPNTMSLGSKEGLSIYGLFHQFARTPQGKHLLRQYFLRPSLDPVVINERLDFAATLLRADNDGPMNCIVKSLRHIKNMRTVMIHLRKGISNGSSREGWIKSGIWSSLRSFAFYTLQIRDAVIEINGVERLTIGTKQWLAEQSAKRSVLFIQSHTSLQDVEDAYFQVDFQSSAEMHRTVINAGVDPELDSMKRDYDGLEDLLNHTSHQIAATVPTVYNLDLNVIFFPQIGFLISIPNNPVTGRGDYEGGATEDQRWKQVFSTTLRAYYKDARMLALDTSCGDMYASVCEKEIEIVHELGQQVLAREEMLNTVSDLCGELDSLLALAQGAKIYKFSRPHITMENVIDIKAGRHPLQELTVSSYVPNATLLVGGPGRDLRNAELDEGKDTSTKAFHKFSDAESKPGPSTLIMTGPNYSGKSVYLKQTALIVYMAHVGCFVPADDAVIGLTDKILTRIATRETVSQFQSTFVIDLQQVALAMALASHRSLVVIDEFGNGTEASDGAGLACGVFQYLLNLKNDRPKVVGATHFHEIFENGFLPQQPLLAFGSMEVHLEREALDLGDQITYLYNFRAGRSILSYGSCCAALNGVETSIIDRADELVELSTRGEDLVAACARMTLQEEEDLIEAARQNLSYITGALLMIN
ncbi:chaperone ATPase hsp78 [Lecanora helva]